jgi:glycosyltransferase involved in cell wall biosynthesis
MRILGLHSFYRRSGGEDISFNAEMQLLRDGGHEVAELTVRGGSLAEKSLGAQARAILLGDPTLRDELRREMLLHRPDVVYLNNWFPWLGPLLPGIPRGVPVLAAVRNYRLWCLNGLQFRQGEPCGRCVAGNFTSGIRFGCYDGSLRSMAATRAVLAARDVVLGRGDVHFAPVSEAVQRHLLRAGLPTERVHLKPNVVSPTPDFGPGGRFPLFVGRLEPEKGIREFLAATRSAGTRPVVVGGGSLGSEIPAWVDYRGELPHSQVLALMGESRMLVVPSLWEEPFGRVAAEALACGTPVIVSDRGGLPEVVDSETGVVVPCGDAKALSRAVVAMLDDDYWSIGARQAARQRYLKRYSPESVVSSLEKALVAACGSQ